MSTINLNSIPRPIIWHISDYLPVQDHYRATLSRINKQFKEDMRAKPTPSITAHFSQRQNQLILISAKITPLVITQFRPHRLVPMSPTQKHSKALAFLPEQHLKIVCYLNAREIVHYARTCKAFQNGLAGEVRTNCVIKYFDIADVIFKCHQGCLPESPEETDSLLEFGAVKSTKPSSCCIIT